jgi:hypothetical protein
MGTIQCLILFMVKKVPVLLDVPTLFSVFGMGTTLDSSTRVFNPRGQE